MRIVNLESKHSINSQQICTLKNQPETVKAVGSKAFANAPDSISWVAQAVRAVGFPDEHDENNVAPGPSQV